MSATLAFILALALSVTDLVVERYAKPLVGWLVFRTGFLSFAAGVGISYMFLVLFPEVFTRLSVLGPSTFLLVLLGFTVYHVSEKVGYKYIQQRKSSLRSVHHSVHLVFYFVYFFLVGVLLQYVARSGLGPTLIFFFPFLLYVMVLHLPQKFEFPHLFHHILYVGSPLYGAFVGFWFPIPENVFVGILAFIAGALLYIIVREAIPPEKKGHPGLFLLGAALYALIVFLIPAKIF